MLIYARCDCGRRLRRLPNRPKGADHGRAQRAYIKDFVKNMNLEVLPELPNTLEILDCSNNKLICLKNLPASLKDLNCSGNNLKLDSMNKLQLDEYFKSVLPPGISRVAY
jgi:hypothetical protein